MPEFLFFEFPPHCFNAVLGDRARAEAGQNALNLRNVFQISVAGIAHLDGTVSWWPGAGEAGGGLVSRGDRGLQGFQGYCLSMLRIRYPVPRMLFCAVFSCLAILRIEGCLNRTT